MGMGPRASIAARATRYEWARRHRAPLIASVITMVVGMNYVVLWPAIDIGKWGIFYAPSDLWGSYLGAVAMVHGHFQSPFLGMVGSLLIEAPAAALGNALHLQVGPTYSLTTAPTAWALMGPWMLALSCTALFALDAAARRLGLSERRRIAFGVVEALLVLNTTAVWGHPEDSVAVGLVIFALLDADQGRLRRSGWLLGAAVAVQPLAILAVPAVAMLVDRRHGRGRIAQLVARSVIPYIALLVPPLVTKFSPTVRWLVQQPNWTRLNHPTPFSAFAAHINHSDATITAGPARLVGIALATGLAVVLCRHATFERCLWAAAAGFWVWAATDSVTDAYYWWPALALVVLLAARQRWTVGIGTAALAGFATWFSNLTWVGEWSWWAVMVSVVGAGVVIAWYTSNAPVPQDRRTRPPRPASGAANAGHDASELVTVVPGPPGTAIIPPWTG